MKSSTAPKNGKQNIEERKALVFRQRLCIGAVIGVVALYLIVSLYFMFHFEPKSYINGINVSGMSLAGAKEKLRDVAPGYVLSVRGPEDDVVTIDSAALRLEVTDAPDAEKCLHRQNPLAWIAGLFGTKEYQIDLVASYDENVLGTWMDNLDMLDEDQMQAPEDAVLTCDDRGYYVIVPEVPGTTVRTEEARAAIREAIRATRPDVNLRDYMVTPQVRETDPNLVTRRDEWNALLEAAGLTYRIAEDEEVLTGPVISSLLVDDGEHVSVSEEKTLELMSVWRDRHDTYKASFPFTTTYGTTINVEPYGDYGYELNEAGTCEDIISRIGARDNGTYDVLYYHEPLFNTNHGLDGTYVEVNIDDQHLWVYKNGKVVCDTDVVTGLPIYESITYHGCYAIKSKEREVVLGSLDLQGYESPVSYWIPFNGGEGLHDAPWREYFGGKIWLTNGSHGCVNVPDWCMDDVYNNVQVGEAVVVYGRQYDPKVYEPETKTVDEDYYYDVYYGE